MKKLFMLVIALAPLCLFSQSRAVNKFYKKYKHEQTSVGINVPGWLLKKTARLVSQDPGHELAVSATKMRFIVVKDKATVRPRDLKRLDRRIYRERFEPLVELNGSAQGFQLYLKESLNDTQQIILITEGAEGLFIGAYEGHFKKEDLERFVRKHASSSSQEL